MNKKFIAALIISSTIFTGIGVQAQELPKRMVGGNEIQTRSTEPYYVRETLYANGYPMEENIQYDYRRDIYNGNVEYTIKVIIDGIRVEDTIRLTTYPWGTYVIRGLSSQTVRDLSSENWNEKYQVGEDYARYRVKYDIYTLSYLNLLDDEIVLEEKTLTYSENRYKLRYSFKSTSRENNRSWRTYIDAETGNVIETYEIK